MLRYSRSILRDEQIPFLLKWVYFLRFLPHSKREAGFPFIFLITTEKILHCKQEVIYIPTCATFYASEATEILNEISTYPGLSEKQILMLHPGKESQTQNILSFLQKQERIYRDKNKGFYKVGCVDRRNHDAIVRSIWVLLDFLTDVEYHAASEYPVMIVFFIRGEEYQIIYAAEGAEGIIGAILRQQSEHNARRIILIDNPWQIENLLYAGITAYCTVTYDGQIHYYKEKRK